MNFLRNLKFLPVTYKQKELATDEECPKMCAYKLVTIKFKWWGLQNKVENFIQKVSASPVLGCCWEVGRPAHKADFKSILQHFQIP